MSEDKKFQGYGLILKKTASVKKGAERLARKKPSAFADESDEDVDDSIHTGVNIRLQQEASRKKLQKQTVLEMQRALEQDPTVYEYDNVYDEMDQKRTDTILQKTKDKTPKYIGHLMKAAEERKLENERRTEKKVQQEREEEGNEFADKDAFVTSSYKNKLREIQEAEEKLKLEAARESAMDVTKQDDLTGFYRYLLNQTVGEVNPYASPPEGGTVKGQSESGDPKKQDNVNQEEGENQPGTKKQDKDSSVKEMGKRTLSPDDESKRDNSNRMKELGSSHRRREYRRKRNHSSDEDYSVDSREKDSREHNSNDRNKSRRDSPSREKSKSTSSKNRVHRHRSRSPKDEKRMQRKDNIKQTDSSEDNKRSESTSAEQKKPQQSPSKKDLSRERDDSVMRSGKDSTPVEIESGSEEIDDPEKNSKQNKPTKEVKPKPVPNKMDVYKKRNTEEDISAARERYLLRRNKTRCIIAQESDEEN